MICRGGITAPTPLTLVLQLRDGDCAPSLSFLRIGPPIGWRVLAAELKLVDLPHVEHRDGLGVVRGRDCHHTAVFAGANQSARIPPRTELPSRYPPACIQRNLESQIRARRRLACEQRHGDSGECLPTNQASPHRNERIVAQRGSFAARISTLSMVGGVASRSGACAISAA